MKLLATMRLQFTEDFKISRVLNARWSISNDRRQVGSTFTIQDIFENFGASYKRPRACLDAANFNKWI